MTTFHLPNPLQVGRLVKFYFFEHNFFFYSLEPPNVST